MVRPARSLLISIVLGDIAASGAVQYTYFCSTRSAALLRLRLRSATTTVHQYAISGYRFPRRNS